MGKNLLTGFILVLLFFTWGQAWADPQGCSICGMDVSRYVHVKYVVSTTDGKTYTTCGVQCGLTFQIRSGDKFKSAVATDLITHKEVEAKKAFYVYKSSVITDMGPGFIAFSIKTNAEKFQKGFGGEVLTYQEALEKWKGQMK
jgi:hypothetical protein